MHTRKAIIPHYLFAFFLLLFIACKIAVLGLPYFWDEAGVYAPAALYLHDHGLGLDPASLPPVLSRGHPLLFVNVLALFYHLFGDSTLTAHIFSLLISCGFFTSVYLIVKRHADATAGLFAAVYCMAQPLLFAQSVLALPEMLLAWMMLLSLHYWSTGRVWLFALFASLALFTKETAVILPVVVFLDMLIARWSKAQTYSWSKVYPILLPYVIFGLFLLLQKQQNGWYFFPYHADAISFKSDRLLLFLRQYFSFVVNGQGRIWSTMVMTILLVVYYRKNKKVRYARFSSVLILLCIGGLLFSSLNFYMNRYMVFVMAAYGILLSVILYMSDIHAYLRYAAFVLVLLAGAYHMRPSVPEQTGNLELSFTYDENMRYTDYLDAEQKAVDMLMENIGPTDSVFANFPAVFALRDTRIGFTDKEKDKDFILQSKAQTQTGFTYALIGDPGAFDHHIPPACIRQVWSYSSSNAHFILYKGLCSDGTEVPE
ncbi:MAG: glycosyltransferase family 39 protein [Chitinophagales bacterium]